jgi:hypothetical protein
MLRFATGTPLNLTIVLPAAIPRRSETVPGCTYLIPQSRESMHSPNPYKPPQRVSAFAAVKQVLLYQ